MATPVYVLAEEGSKIVDNPEAVWAARRVTVRGGKWYEARATAFEHAISEGHGSVIIMAGTAELLHRAHWNGNGPETKLTLCSDNDKHGLWLYMDRLTRRFGHVYVPGVGACLPWKTRRTHPWQYINNPTVPMVAAYRTSALQSLSSLDGPLGKLLCGQGYDSFTLSDFFYQPYGGYVLDETGSATTWNQAYERAKTLVL